MLKDLCGHHELIQIMGPSFGLWDKRNNIWSLHCAIHSSETEHAGYCNEESRTSSQNLRCRNSYLFIIKHWFNFGKWWTVSYGHGNIITTLVHRHWQYYCKCVFVLFWKCSETKIFFKNNTHTHTHNISVLNCSAAGLDQMLLYPVKSCLEIS